MPSNGGMGLVVELSPMPSNVNAADKPEPSHAPKHAIGEIWLHDEALILKKMNRHAARDVG